MIDPITLAVFFLLRNLPCLIPGTLELLFRYLFHAFPVEFGRPILFAITGA